MQALLLSFVEIALLRRAPQSLPTSSFLLGLTLTAYCLVTIIWYAMNMPVSRAIFVGIAETALLGILTGSLLYAQGRISRLYQTLAAMAGALCLVTIIAIPAFKWLTNSKEPSLISVLVIFGLIGWSLVVMAHVLRHALDVHLAFAMVISVVFVVLTHQVVSSLLGT